MKVIYFDVDGSIADLYGVDGWLDCLLAHDPRPYAEARPFFSIDEVVRIFEMCIKAGYRVGVISWCSREKNKEFDKLTREVKKAWLQEHFPIASEVHIVAYGTPKWKVIDKSLRADAILVDDEDKNLADWSAHCAQAIRASDFFDFVKGKKVIDLF